MSSRQPEPPCLHPFDRILPSLPRTTSSNLIEDVRSGNRKVGIAYSTNINWPFSFPLDNNQTSSPLLIHILDSSFNPPTKAHLALARTQGNKKPSVKDAYIANILLLSVSNADKTTTDSDASYIQRVEMMVLMADFMATSLPPQSGGVAIIAINEPLFARKQEILSDYMGALMWGSMFEVDLVWQMGFDTLKRLVDKKYYGDDESKMLRTINKFLRKPDGLSFGGKLICAHRQVSGTEFSISDFPGLLPFLESGRVEIVGVGSWESTLSSSSVRERIRRNDASWMESCVNSIGEYVERGHLYLTQN